MSDIDELFRLASLAQDFSEIHRLAYHKNGARMENDAEHSFLLALISWYAADRMGPTLNRQKILEYALAHDLVEVYAGDTPAYDIEKTKTKAAREAEAAEKLKETFPEFKSLHTAIERYESSIDEEARFVRAMDKIAIMLTEMLCNHKTCEEKSVTQTQHVNHKVEKITATGSKEGMELLEQAIDKLKKEYPNFK